MKRVKFSKEALLSLDAILREMGITLHEDSNTNDERFIDCSYYSSSTDSLSSNKVNVKYKKDSYEVDYTEYLNAVA